MRKIRNFYHWFLALLGSCWYGRPSRKIFVLGVTGTKGKSTVLELTNAILEAGGKKTGQTAPTVRFIGGQEANHAGRILKQSGNGDGMILPSAARQTGRPLRQKRPATPLTDGTAHPWQASTAGGAQRPAWIPP